MSWPAELGPWQYPSAPPGPGSSQRGYKRAPRLRRVGAAFIDWPIALSVLMSPNSKYQLLALAWIVMNSVILQGWRGQSLGKLLMHIQLVQHRKVKPDFRNQPPLWNPGYAVCALRCILHVLDIAPCCLGFFRIFTDNESKTFADTIVGTVCVKGRHNLTR